MKKQEIAMTSKNQDPKALLSQVNSNASRLRNMWLVFLAVTAYFWATLAEISHVELLAGDRLSIPIVDINLSTVGFFVFAPLFYFTVLTWLVFQVLLFQSKAHALIALSSDDKQTIDWHQIDSFALQVAPFDRTIAYPERLVLSGGWFLSTFILPIATMLYFQAVYLPVHSAIITGIHMVLVHLVVCLGGYLILIRKAPNVKRTVLDGKGYVFAFSAALSVFLSWFVLAQPGGIGLSRIPYIVDEELNYATRSQKSFVPRNFVLIDRKGGEVRERLQSLNLTERDFRGALLANSNFSGLDFRGSDLSDSRLFESDFSGADLGCIVRNGVDRSDMKCTDLTSVHATGAIFNSANTSGADFSNSFLSRTAFSRLEIDCRQFEEEGHSLDWCASFDNALLSHAKFQNSNISNASFLNADLSGTDFIQTRIAGSNFEGANLSGVLFEGVDLTGTKFDGAVFGCTNEEEPNEKCSSFVETNLTDTSFEATNLDGMHFSSLSAGNANFSNAEMSGSFFDRVDLTEANLSEIQSLGLMLEVSFPQDFNLRGVGAHPASLLKPRFHGSPDLLDFRGVNLPEYELSGSEMYSVDFSGANLGGAKFKGAELRFVNFQGADLRNVDFSYARLERPDFRGALLDGAKFSGAQLLDPLLGLASFPDEESLLSMDLRDDDNKALATSMTEIELKKVEVTELFLRSIERIDAADRMLNLLKLAKSASWENNAKWLAFIDSDQPFACFNRLSEIADYYCSASPNSHVRTAENHTVYLSPTLEQPEILDELNLNADFPSLTKKLTLHVNQSDERLNTIPCGSPIEDDDTRELVRLLRISPSPLAGMICPASVSP